MTKPKRPKTEAGWPRTTPRMRAAIDMLHGSPKSAREARADLRTLTALERAGLATCDRLRRPAQWRLTAAGVHFLQEVGALRELAEEIKREPAA